MYNDYSRLRNNNDTLESASKLSSQTFFTTSINEEHSLNEKKFSEYLSENSKKHQINDNSSQQQHNKIVGGVKVYPTILHEQKQAALIRKNKIDAYDENHQYTMNDYRVGEKTSTREVIYLDKEKIHVFISHK